MALVDEIMVFEKDRVKKYAIQKLAQTLYKKVEHDEPRDKVDWITAEEFVNRCQEELQAMNREYCASIAYEVLEREKIQLKGILKEKERLLSLTKNLSEEEKNRHLNLVLEKPILELYRLIQRSELLIEGCYGRIRQGQAFFPERV